MGRVERDAARYSSLECASKRAQGLLGRGGACESARRSGRGRAVVDQHAVCGASVVQHVPFLTQNVSLETTELVFYLSDGAGWSAHFYNAKCFPAHHPDICVYTVGRRAP